MTEPSPIDRSFRPSWLLAIGARPIPVFLGGFALLGAMVFFWISSAPQAGAVENSEGRSYEVRWEERAFEEKYTSCMACHETLKRRNGRPAREHITSAHYRASINCNECHGGDPELDLEEEAHDETKGFLGKLDRAEMIDRCGACHPVAAEKFKTSKHFPEHEGVRQVTCMECHGAHNVGAGARPPEFSWVTTCNDCHDLENVAGLPEEILTVMQAKDTFFAKMRTLRLKVRNRPFAPEVMEPLREVRQLSADFIHSTQVEAIGKPTAEIFAKTRALEQRVAALLQK